jgi:hypothetical protein
MDGCRKICQALEDQPSNRSKTLGAHSSVAGKQKAFDRAPCAIRRLHCLIFAATLPRIVGSLIADSQRR